MASVAALSALRIAYAVGKAAASVLAQASSSRIVRAVFTLRGSVIGGFLNVSACVLFVYVHQKYSGD